MPSGVPSTAFRFACCMNSQALLFQGEHKIQADQPNPNITNCPSAITENGKTIAL